MGPFRSHAAAGSQPTSGAERPVERFRPTTGLFVGYAGLAMAAFALGYAVLFVPGVVGVRVALAATFAAVVVWVTQLRPRATAYREHLRLKGSLRDTDVPYVLIDEVAMGQMLHVWVGERRYVCIGIGLSLGTDIRRRAREDRRSSPLGASRSHEFSERAAMSAPDQTAMGYHTFVVTRIEELVAEARKQMRRRGETADSARVTSRYAVPEIVALSVTGVAFLASLLL